VQRDGIAMPETNQVPSPILIYNEYQRNIKTSTAPYDIDDDTPLAAEIELAVLRLQPGKAPGPSGMHSDHLKGWLQDAKWEVMPDGTMWCKLVDLVQEVWTSGVLPTVLPWATVVLLPKDSGGHCGIGLLEIVWKLITSIIDARIKAKVEFFHDVLHGFQAKRSTGTAIIEAKLLQQLATIDQVPLYKVFLDL